MLKDLTEEFVYFPLELDWYEEKPSDRSYLQYPESCVHKKLAQTC